MNSSKEFLTIRGARENNLKNINLDIPKNKLVVMTGVSGSGKTSLAFDTIYQEGQRRYVESLSSYARQFLGSFEKPDVDSIDGLSPSISIDQKSTSNNPRSTVGTVTEIYDYYRLLYARIGKIFDPNTNEEVKKYTIDEIVEVVLKNEVNTKIMVLAKVETKKPKETILKLIKDGFTRIIINNNVVFIDDIDITNFKTKEIHLIIDRILLKEDSRTRIDEAISLALKTGGGICYIRINDEAEVKFATHYELNDHTITIPNLEPRVFSFNTPLGACGECNGLGIKLNVSKDLVLDYNKTLNTGGLLPYKNNFDENIDSQSLEYICKYFAINMDIPIRNIPNKALDIILYGTKEKIKYSVVSSTGKTYHRDSFEGVITNLQRRYYQTNSEFIRSWIESFMSESVCPSCRGARLKREVLLVKIGGLNIFELTNLSVSKSITWFKNLQLSKEDQKITNLALAEIKNRLSFLNDVGLTYLSLSRSASTLSGGESQRIRLATQIGSKLTGVLYVLDEPSIGLHQKDNALLIKTLKKMRDLGNSILVVEHDEEIMKEADYLIDIGPLAGDLGGQVVACGTPLEVMQNENSITGRYLSGIYKISYPNTRRTGIGNEIIVVGAKANNLKDITVSFPVGTFICVTGVSGSGKSSLVNDCLLKGLRYKYYSTKELPGLHDAIIDHGLIEKLVEISQAPIGRTPRSNPATYTGVFDLIRELFAQTKDALTKGFDKGRFSFNKRGGRCEVCQGEGVKKITMHFLPDVYVVCEVCKGTRYNYETLTIKYKGMSIAQILNMTVVEAMEFFAPIPKIYHILKTLNDVGLDYIKLGQSATTLSGGEAQRVKLSDELQKKITAKTLFILDEPTTGLHAHDIKKLINILHKIVDEGGTVIVIEHNLDLIKNADYIIDLGPEGGDAGGNIVVVGTPEEIIKRKESHTAKYLNKMLNYEPK